ncbi:MAG: trigger factor, partial [Deltaproteobacteria bacterium]|nr:trigger factor [Deltaproteobacteria bacterium]
MVSLLKVKVEEPAQFLRRLEVTVPASEVDAAFHRSLSTLKSKVHIPGFRQGKIPTQVILQRFRKNIEAEVLSLLLENRLEEIITGQQLEPVTTPRLDPGTLAQGTDFVFSIEFEVLPRLELVGLELLEVTIPTLQVTAEELRARLEKMRLADAQYRTVEGRQGVLAGDMLIVDTVTTVEGKEPYEEKGEQILLGEGNLLPEIEEGLLRARIGEPVHMGVTMPQSHRTLAGKKMLFEMTVQEIRERILPDLDDEWARDHDKDSLAELEAELTEQLRQEKEQERELLANQRILDKIVEAFPFDIPPGLARAEAEKRMSQMARYFGQMDQALAGEVFEGLRRSTRDRAYQDIRRAMIVQSVIRQQGIEVSDEALEEKIAALAQ